MTTLDTTQLAASGRSTGLFSNAFGAVAAWNDARVTRKALLALSARELDDIGITRGDIEAIALGSSKA